MQLSVPLILASQSPRRKKLLEQLGLSFQVIVRSTDERIPPGVEPAAIVQTLANQKANPIAVQNPDSLTLAADTIVVLHGRILGKPQSTDDAHAMLRSLSGKTHTVFTGLALQHPTSNRSFSAVESTDVTFASLSDAEIQSYVATGSPMDKAGAYGIQDDFGAVFVKQITGDYYNVVGLPLHRLYVTLRTQFPDFLPESQ